MTRTTLIYFWSGVAALCALSVWGIWEWWFIVGQLSIPLDYFMPVARARSNAQLACALAAPLLVVLSIAFFRFEARLTKTQRVVAAVILGLALAVLLLYVSAPRLRPTA